MFGSLPDITHSPQVSEHTSVHATCDAIQVTVTTHYVLPSVVQPVLIFVVYVTYIQVVVAWVFYVVREFWLVDVISSSEHLLLFYL